MKKEHNISIDLRKTKLKDTKALDELLMNWWWSVVPRVDSDMWYLIFTPKQFKKLVKTQKNYGVGDDAVRSWGFFFKARDKDTKREWYVYNAQCGWFEACNIPAKK